MLTLTAGNAEAFLRERGWIGPAETVRIAELSGGVSNMVLLVESSRQRFVVKQALPQLRVKEEWLCAVDRILAEERAIETLSRLVGGDRLPSVLYSDRAQYAFAMTAAAPGAVNWKAELLAGRIDPEVAAAAGELLGQIHTRAAATPGMAEAFADDRFFVDLRLDPYYRTTAARHPDLAVPILAQAERMRRAEERLTLVHGDFSPKNMLLSGGRLLLLDFEVAHWGDPTFDVAFCLNHFFLKAVHRPLWTAGYLTLARRFWGAYELASQFTEARALLPTTLKQLGCLLLARVDGKSPAEYLTAESRREVVRTVARRLLLGAPQSLDDVAEALLAADPTEGRSA